MYSIYMPSGGFRTASWDSGGEAVPSTPLRHRESLRRLRWLSVAEASVAEASGIGVIERW
ncbi:hypothetical protein [Cyclobacterium plantarum]|uniref:Uncharacterized protein n=1 Tax=Cyclobacterium plantarum TaxID=2716263 RepID=A0ABX0HEH9_9BACT|nr:hypothetical protein [Cyclobacterium plantarum]NHE59348.1 hypothetical protein [Cyclobacterium plantarum]